MASYAPSTPERVEIPAYMDRWMMGDRFGVVTKLTERNGPGGPTIAHVLLDKSGKLVRVVYDECRFL